MVKADLVGGGGPRGSFYDQKNVLSTNAVNTIIASGYLNVGAGIGTAASDFDSTPGFAAHPGHSALGRRVFALWGNELANDGAASRIGGSLGGRGVKYYIKGRLVCLAGTPLDGAFFPFTVGLSASPLSSSIESFFGHETEDTRDEASTIAMVIDDSNNIQTYNNVFTGDATLTDSLKNVTALAASVGVGFEMTIEIPAAAVNLSTWKISFKIQDDTGAMVSILTDTLPVVGSASNFIPYLGLNVNATIEDLVYQVEKL